MSSINYIRFPSGNLWTEVFGDRSSSLVILIAGAQKQGIYWSESWCNAFVQKGYCVVRFDHRDTGFSTHIDFNASPYRLQDMTHDILCILEFYGKEKAHLIGSGMGGYLAQMLAVLHPEKVTSLVLLMTTHDATSIEQRREEGYRIPSTSMDIYAQLERVSRIAFNDPHWLSKTLQKLRLLNGTHAFFDEAAWELFVIHLKARMGQGMVPVFFHHHLTTKTLSKLMFECHRIAKPTLIIHGDADPIIPIEHAYATKNLIPQAKLTVVEGMGHLLTPCFELKIIVEIGN